MAGALLVEVFVVLKNTEQQQQWVFGYTALPGNIGIVCKLMLVPIGYYIAAQIWHKIESDYLQ